MRSLTVAEVLRHVAANLEAGREPKAGLLARWKGTGEPFTKHMGAKVWGLDEMLRNNFEYCLAPKTITYTVTHPEPLRVAPKFGERAWTFGPSGDMSVVIWNNNIAQCSAFERGNIFATEADAQAAAAARLAAYRSAT